ncbi:MAG: hypothetical protein R2867_31060 [Caldilineaceae bacterium]
MTATRIVTPAPVTATLAVTPLAGTRTAAVSASGTPGLLSPGAVTTPGAIAQPTITLAPTVTPTSLFRNYVALVVSQLQRTATPTATLLPVPIVLTPTPRPVTPTATALPTMTPTPFTGSVRLLNRDPVYEKDWIPAVAYVEPDSYFDKSWSTFYQRTRLIRILSAFTPATMRASTIRCWR